MFSQMVEDLTPKLQKKTTNCRKPLFPGLKLAITVGYLATGDSYKSLAYGFRVAPNTIVSVVLEVCQAIYDYYHETAFKCPTTEEQWTEVHGPGLVRQVELPSLLWLHRWEACADAGSTSLWQSVLQLQRLILHHHAGSSGCQLQIFYMRMWCLWC